MYISGAVLFCLFMYFWSRDKERTKQLEEIKQSIQNQSHTHEDEYDGMSPEVYYAAQKANEESYKFLSNFQKELAAKANKPQPKIYSNPLEQWYQDALANNNDKA